MFGKNRTIGKATVLMVDFKFIEDDCILLFINRTESNTGFIVE